MRKLILMGAVLASVVLSGCAYRPYPGDRYYGGGYYGDRYDGGTYRNDGYYGRPTRDRDYRYDRGYSDRGYYDR